MRSNIFKGLTIVILILGLIGGIVLGFQIPSVNYNTLSSEFNFGLMIGSWIGTAILSFIFYGVYSILLYLEQLGAGDENITVNTSSYQNVNDNNSKNNKSEEKADSSSWKCPICGKVNQNYVGTCGCGTTKPVSNTLEKDVWECPNCHSKNNYSDSSECPKCHWKP